MINSPYDIGRYTHVILDEVHERSAESGRLGLATKLLSGSSFPHFCLVTMSATMQEDLVASPRSAYIPNSELTLNQ